MTSITEIQLLECYKASRDRVVRGTETAPSVASDLANSIGMNEQSCENHIRLLQHLLQSEEKRLNAQENAVDLYLDEIKKDFGPSAYEDALIMIIRSSLKHFRSNSFLLDSCANAVERLKRL